MKSRDYLRILMAPLSMLTVFACSPNQFQQTKEYDDVYFTSSDRLQKPTIIESTKEVEEANEKAYSLNDYSNDIVDPTLVSKYNNGQEIVYYEDGPRVKKAADLNYDDFVWDYENEQLAYYELPLDWSSDWDRSSFNSLMVNDYQFQLAWYEQYYLGDDFRMNSYLSGRYGNSRRNSLVTPRVGLDIAFVGGGYSPFFYSSMTYVNLNRFGAYDPFWSPIYDPFWGYGAYSSFYYTPFYTSIGFGRPWGWNRWNRWNHWNNWGYYGGYNNYYYGNIYVNNEGNFTRNGRTLTRGARVSSTSVSSVRSDAINGTSPRTRSSSISGAPSTRSSRISNSSLSTVRGARNNSTAIGSSTRSSRARTSAYQFSGTESSRRSNTVRSSRSSSVESRVSGARVSTPAYSGTTRTRSSSNLFSRSSSARSSVPSYSRSSSSRSSGVTYRNNSSSRSSSGSSRSNYSRSNSSSNRSSGSVNRSTGSSRSSSSGSVGRSSSSGSSRSSGTGSSRSSSSSSGSSRSGRGN